MTEEESGYSDEPFYTNDIPSSEDLIAEAYAAARSVVSQEDSLSEAGSLHDSSLSEPASVYESTYSYVSTNAPPEFPVQDYASTATRTPRQYAGQQSKQSAKTASEYSARRTTRQSSEQTGGTYSPPSPGTSTYTNTPSGSPRQTGKASGFSFFTGLFIFVAVVVIIPMILMFSEGGMCSDQDISDTPTGTYKPNTIETELVRVGSEVTGFIDIPASFELETDENADGSSLRYVDPSTNSAIVITAYPQEEGIDQQERAKESNDSYLALGDGYADLYEDEYFTDEINGTVDQVYASVFDHDTDELFLITEFYFTTSDEIVRSIAFIEGSDTSYSYRYEKGGYGTYFSIVSMMYNFALSS